MAATSVKGAMVAGPLANVSVQYRNQSYVAGRVFPIIERVPAKAKITTYKKGAYFRDEAGIRGPGAEAPRGGLVTDSVDILPVEYAFASPVTDEDRRWTNQQGAPPLNPDQDAIELSADKIDLKKERLIASMVLGGTWSGVAGEDAAGLWAPNDATNTFIADVLARIETIRSSTGIKPNMMLMDFGTYNALKKLDALLDRIKYTQRGILGADLIAAIFDLEEVIIGEAIYSTAKEKKDGTDFTASNCWEKNAGKGSAFLYYAPRTPGLKIPSAGYQCREWYGNGQARRTVTWREDSWHQDVYEVAESVHIVQTGADLGFLWYDTILT
ncbi:MAG: hypothetical protein HGA78_01195 [Nitrospirales bacterium]|nr:hypothetical protein [Nitrospirales bacterium]